MSFQSSAHKWIDVPSFRTEIRNEMGVRESCHTAMLWDKKYQNIDTGKFNRDKMHSIKCIPMDELIDGWSCYNGQALYQHSDDCYMMEEHYNAIKFPVREKELLRIKKQKDKESKAQLEIQRKLHQERLEYDEKQREYSRYLVEQRRLIDRQKEQLRIREEELNIRRKKREEEQYVSPYGASVGNIRPNKWRTG